MKTALKFTLMALVAGTLALAAIPNVVKAEDPAATTTEGEGGSTGAQKSFFQAWVLDGGAIGFVIIALSIASLALSIEHAFSCKKEILAPPELLMRIEDLVEDGDVEEALFMVQANQSYFAKVLEAGLNHIDEDPEAFEAAMENASEEQALKLKQKLSYLGLCGSIGPMMGLFGTVVGMIIAFNKLAQSGGTPDPAQLALGISMALVTTFQGLFVAIPSLVSYTYFKNKLEGILLEVGNLVSEYAHSLQGGSGGE